jgi:hypothetical protein
MARRPKHADSEPLRQQLVALLENFEVELRSPNLRRKVLALVDAYRLLGDLGCSLIPRPSGTAARDRIIFYLRKYPGIAISGDELQVVAGISEWARRLRELRVQFGWPILSGVTAREMAEEGELRMPDVDAAAMKPDDYVLASTNQDLEAAHRWHVANDTRRLAGGVRDRLLAYMRANVGKPVTGEELRYVAKGKTEWARRVRELRTEEGWPVVTRNTGRPDLSVGTYLLESDRQTPEHDRKIPDPVRCDVLVRDYYRCVSCGWTHDKWNRSDPRHLELHHIKPHVEKGSNEADNLGTLCTVCHDDVHRRLKRGENVRLRRSAINRL